MLFGSLKFYYLELVLYPQTDGKRERLNQICEMVLLNARLKNDLQLSQNIKLLADNLSAGKADNVKRGLSFRMQLVMRFPSSQRTVLEGILKFIYQI